jgi:tetratricopeptide (TPR) repeat protein
LGLAALEIERRREARDNFALAAQADPNFALAHLGLALTATTPEATARNLSLAARGAEGVTEGERLRIAIATEGWKGNLVSRLDLASRLTELHRTEPRAWRILAGAREALNQIEASREALRRAEELEPESTPTLIALARSHMLKPPSDLERAVEFARRATAGTPDLPSLHLLLGDVLLVNSGIAEARDAYERADSLAPRTSRALARLGYMLALEGQYDSARANFDAAIGLADGDERVTVEVSRALVHVYADEPQATVEELFNLAEAWDTLGVSPAEREEFQIRALTPAARIAMHHGLLTVAGRALERRAGLLRRQADRVGSTEFRRRQEAKIAYMNALLAAHEGDENGAEAEVERFGSLVAEQASYRKLEPVMEVLGLISLMAGEFGEAVSYFERTDLGDPYNRWQLGRAHLGTGDAETAAAIFQDLARADIESVGFALVGLDATRPGP